MKLPAFLKKSIGLTQAVAVLLASLIISLVLSAVQLGYTFSSQHREAVELNDEILTLAEGGATTASWTLDSYLASEVIQSVIALRDVQSATLLDEEGNVLASAESEGHQYSAFTRRFADAFIGTSMRGQRDLHVTTGSSSRKVGTFSVVLAPEHVAERFLGVATPVLIAGLIQALAIGLVLLWLSSRLVTSPLQRAARAIASIDPEEPAANAVEIPPIHKHNELGHLLQHTNDMVKRLSSVQEQLRTIATHDALTELPNRSFVVARLERAIARAARSETRVAVLFLDLDDFKGINDSHGHTHGDTLLRQMADRLRAVLRSNDSVGRLGGDEFLIVVENLHSAEDVVPTVQRIKNKLAQPFDLGGSQVRVGCSIGVAMFPDDGGNANDLMRHSDMAMYQAKVAPGSQFHFYAQEMSERMQERQLMASAMREALQADEFELAYQPKISARTGDLHGCEVLLRWQRGGRLVAAGEFIDIAEQTGIIVDIGYHVLERACDQARDWAARFEPIPVAINVSAQQLREHDFAERVIDAASRYQLDPGLLELEITESVLIEELDHAGEKLETLRNAGFTVSIDDFGTGYSSLAYLTRLPANSLKIDRSFVSGPQRSEVVLDMIIAMAKALNLTIIGEGVETREQRENLVTKGCDVLQGYLLGRPMSARQFEDKLLKPAA